LRYFFLGSTDRVLEKIAAKMKREFPHVTVCGVLSPPFKEEFTEEENRQMVEHINRAAPDVLWVGMTAPKQEKWIYENRHSLEVPLLGAIGAVFDFYAGTKKRAPKWICDMGLEWLPRLLREPRRLFRRNFMSSPLFLLMIFAELVGLYNAGNDDA
jgi:N-acetylglucosaminyldiphosphoundecaprenol N-acetyl-beta-D-mannosaminyltransferase